MMVAQYLEPGRVNLMGYAVGNLRTERSSGEQEDDCKHMKKNPLRQAGRGAQ
jgi:hypothetical protein